MHMKGLAHSKCSPQQKNMSLFAVMKSGTLTTRELARWAVTFSGGLNAGNAEKCVCVCACVCVCGWLTQASLDQVCVCVCHWHARTGLDQAAQPDKVQLAVGNCQPNYLKQPTALTRPRVPYYFKGQSTNTARQRALPTP